MAKIAKVGYGSDGRGLGRTKGEIPQGYTYVVNDNVRTGDTIQVVATSSKGRKFGTTGKTLHTFKETSVKGQQAKQDIQENSRNLQEPTRAYSGKELGVSGFRGGKGYVESSRGGNISEYIKQNPNQDIKLTENAQKSLNTYNQAQQKQETFDEYSKKYMK